MTLVRSRTTQGLVAVRVFVAGRTTSPPQRKPRPDST
jgi:hypothetical protein